VIGTSQSILIPFRNSLLKFSMDRHPSCIYRSADF
jgi:hypothetical protein